MPRNIEITEEEQNVYEKGGGIKDATKKEREWVAYWVKVERKPKQGYALKMRSQIRMEVLSRFKIDLTDPILFPDFKRRWKSCTDSLDKDGI